MRLVAYEVRFGLVAGLLVGIKEYEFQSEGVYEKDFVLYLGIFSISLTLIYNDN